jgi:hypothetical protein
MKPIKILAIVIVSYVGIVVAFESLIGFFQPTAGDTLVIITTETDGTRHERVLSTINSGGKLYVAANHWPRAWYGRALANPDIEIELEGKTSARRAVRVTGAEYARVKREHELPLVVRILTGFPPRTLLRLDPR